VAAVAAADLGLDDLSAHRRSGSRLRELADWVAAARGDVAD
jgi:hypothetical protein